MKELICITCPNGCHLTAEETASGLVIKGNKCPKGEKYGQDEMTNPLRTVTAVARTVSEDWPCVPVKTSGAIPVKLVFGLLKEIYSLTVRLPVMRGDPVISDFAGAGIDVVCTRSLPPPG
jgi:CxxC motif-containing protein